MQGRSALALAVVLVVAGVVGVQLADPFRPAVTVPDVDPADPPAEQVRAALHQVEDGDYTAATVVRALDGRESRRAGTVRVDEGRRALAEGALLDDSYVEYANEHVAWAGRPGHLRRSGGDLDSVRPDFEHLDVLDGATVAVVAENATTATFRVADTDAAWALARHERSVTDEAWAIEEDLRANLTVTVDRETGHLRRVRFVDTRLDGPAGNRTREGTVTVVTYAKWGETTVERPPDAGYSLAEFLLDVSDR